MKIFFTVIVFCFVSHPFFAQNVELSNRLISQYQIHQLKGNTMSSHLSDHLWLTPLLKEVFNNWKDLTKEAQLLFSPYEDRPTFSGTEKMATVGNFVFHYTTDSGDAGEDVDAADLNSNDIPDYVEYMAQQFNKVSELYHTETGLTVPPFDEDEVNGAYYDIYISGKQTGDDLYGYVKQEKMIGDNLNSPSITEVDAATSFMVLRNEYSGIFGDPSVAISVTVAHEYMHAVQNGYSSSMEIWFMETGATWAEEFAFPGYDDNFQYLMDLFGKTDVALNLKNDEDAELNNHWYSSWLFAKYLTEQTETGIMKNIYERCIEYKAVDAIDMELTLNWDSSLDDFFVKYLIANLLMTSDDGFAPFTYQRAEDYDEYIENNGGLVLENGSTPLAYSGSDITWNSQTDGDNRLMRLSADYFSLTADRNFRLSLSSETPNDEVGLIVVKMKQDALAFEVQDENGWVNVTDQADWSLFIPIVVRIDKEETTTEPFNYNLNISSAATTAIEKSPSEGIRIFPNPADDYITIDVDGMELYSMELIDLSGSVILQGNLSSNKMDVSQVNNGIYFLKIADNKGQVRIEKIIIKH